jgi:hypothetical protein
VDATRAEPVGSAFWPFWQRNIHGANFLFSLAFGGEELFGGTPKRAAGTAALPITRREWKEIDRIALQSRWPEG